MTSLTLKNISHSFGADSILSDVSFSVQDDTRLGLVGPNGAGKTTLLRIICGEIQSDAGTIEIPKNISVGYLEQEAQITAQTTVWNLMLGVYKEVFSLEKRLRTLEHDMCEAAEDKKQWEKISLEYDKINKAFEDADGYGYKSAIRGVLKGLELGEDLYQREAGTLSGGQRSRLMLAKLLLEKPGLLLLDEPTNHLDTKAISWLEGYLKTWQGAVILVSHDRWFLDQLCTHIADLRKGKIDTYKGNYTSYTAQRKEKIRLLQKAYEHNQADLKRQKQVVEQYKVWGRIGGGKNFIKANARQKILDKTERVEKVQSDKKSISLKLNAGGRGGNDVLLAENLAMAFDSKQIFSGLDLKMLKGDKAALIGANGIGKTTLLKIISSNLKPTQGQVSLGAGITVSYYDQLQQNLNSGNTVLEEIQNAYPYMDNTQARNALASFLFCGDDVFKKISLLSGGEKGRLSLLKLMLGQGNFLLLDEPTNHLDMDSREMLEEALSEFDGTVLFVSHDRYFINKVANRVLDMKSGSLTKYNGNWSDYLEFLEKQKKEEQEPEKQDITKTALAKQKRADKEKENALRETKRRITEIEKDIESQEERLEQIESALANTEGLGEERLIELSAEHESVQGRIDELMQAWEEAHG